MTSPQSHRVQWTPEKVGRFWDRMTKITESDYFSWQVGDRLLGLTLPRLGSKPQRLLDFGCGPGFLLEKIARRGIVCAGVDFSSVSVETAKERLADQTYLRELEVTESLPTRLPADTFDAIYFTETIEHLLPQQLTPTLNELFRLTAPGGHVVVTTPHDEDLEKGTLECPDCGCQFHHMQHVHRWTKAGLSTAMSAAGFEPVWVEAVMLSQNDWASRGLAWLRQTFRGQRPNLIYIGRKRVRASQAVLSRAA